MSDDFFSSLSRRRPADAPPAAPDTHDDFANAISLRFGSADLRTARLLPGDLPPPSLAVPPPPPPPPPPRPPSLPPQLPFSSVSPSALAPYLADPRTLLLDIRPHAAHAAARITHALSLSVPTTLLKRPLFSLSKLSQMLPSPSARARFADWSSASCILVYDSDSALSPDNSIIAGLLRKFRAEGFTGELGWLRGGFQAVWKEARHLTTTELPTPEEDDPDPASSSGTLRTTHLPKAAFSHFSTTAPPPQPSRIPGSHAVPNTPAASASRAANPFFDTIRQNLELSHGVTERIPLRLPRRVRRRIHDLPFRWLQDIARRSALRHSPASRHPGLDSLESGSESSDDPHTSDPDENDPNVEEGAEALAMQFYRIELAEQRRLRSIMEHHTRESQLIASIASAKSRRTFDIGSANIVADRGQAGVSGAKSVPGTPHPAAFPFSITAGVEKGTKNRYTHIWPFEHARVRLHDSRHQGSHRSRREKGKTLERGRGTRDRPRGKGKEREEQGQEQGKHRRSRSSPAFGESQDQDATKAVNYPSRYSLYFDDRSPIPGTSEAGLARPTLSPSPNVPRVKIEYDVTEQDSRMSGPPTPATALPLLTPPFYTPMETPMRARPPQLLSLPSGISVSPGGSVGGIHFTLPTSSLPSPGLLPFPLRLPSHLGGLLPSIGEQTWASEPPPSSAAPFGAFPTTETAGEVENDTGVMHDPRIESSPVDDYVNASYVQPLGTHKRYIATQGPLPSTYVDFWTLVWEQNVHVIVMLTREVENATVKCGTYWTDTEYGPLRLELLSTSPLMSPSANPSMNIPKQGFFDIRNPRRKMSSASRGQPTLITRTFAFSHTAYPGVPPRRITHLQYLDWSDMNVPDDPRGVLDLVNKVEQAVVESTPGPSPGGSLSPGSGSGSLSGSQSPDASSDQKGYDTSLLSPTSAAVMPRGRKRHRSEWRHPELDSRTGIVSSALGKAAPVLLHCSAGVGRTGGFIAVDAVLDGIRRELRKSREERRLKKASRVSRAARVGVDDEASGEISVESTETGVNTVNSHGEECSSDESGRMDVDEPPVDMAEKVKDPLHIINTVPIHVSAGDRAKGRRRHYPSKDPSGEEQRSSSESLVVHVPCAGTDDVPEGANVASIDLDDPKEVGWQSSTREWVEQVSDQTHAHAEEGGLPPPPPPPPSSRERSPGSTSNSSGPSALNSADESVNGSASVDANGSAGVSSSGSGNRVERKSNTGSATGSGSGSGNGDPPPSLVSKPGSGSISFSNSGSGTGTCSRFGSSLLHARLRDSSATSISADSTDSLSPEHGLKVTAPFHQPSAIHISLSFDMEIDCPPRPASVPLQPAHSGTVALQRAVHSRHDKPVLGSSPAASVSTPVLPPAVVTSGIPLPGDDAAEGSMSRPSLVLGSDELPSLPQEFESGASADVAGSGKNSHILSDESEDLVVPVTAGSSPQVNPEPSYLKGQEISHSSGSVKNPPLPSREANCREKAMTPSVAHVPDDAATQQPTAATGTLGASAHDQRGVGYPVIDYKLPQEFHSDLSPRISSFAEPICVVIQDMREQRMSLCQSLRQYVFVHAAIIEGALRIVDEEHEIWGYSGTSDDASSAEEPGASVRTGGGRPGRSESKAWFGGTNEAGTTVKTPELEYGDIPHGTHPLHTIARPSSYWSRGSQVPLASPSSMSSPSKGKRGPSPTELLREDKTGALSLNKRPSIHRKTTSVEAKQVLLEPNKSSPVAGENGGSSRDMAMGVNVTQPASGRLAVPEKGGSTSDSAR